MFFTIFHLGLSLSSLFIVFFYISVGSSLSTFVTFAPAIDGVEWTKGVTTAGHLGSLVGAELLIAGMAFTATLASQSAIAGRASRPARVLAISSAGIVAGHALALLRFTDAESVALITYSAASGVILGIICTIGILLPPLRSGTLAPMPPAEYTARPSQAASVPLLAKLSMFLLLAVAAFRLVTIAAFAFTRASMGAHVDSMRDLSDEFAKMVMVGDKSVVATMLLGELFVGFFTPNILLAVAAYGEAHGSRGRQQALLPMLVFEAGILLAHCNLYASSTGALKSAWLTHYAIAYAPALIATATAFFYNELGIQAATNKQKQH